MLTGTSSSCEATAPPARQSQSLNISVNVECHCSRHDSDIHRTLKSGDDAAAMMLVIVKALRNQLTRHDHDQPDPRVLGGAIQQMEQVILGM